MSKNNNAGNFGEIIRRMHELYIPSKEKSIKDFFNMLKIYIILVINITPIDFGGVQPNNPPTPPYINLELLRKGTNDFHNGGSYENFEKILAISLKHIYNYEIYQENTDLRGLLKFLIEERDNLINKKLMYINSAIGQINNIIEIIDKNNAATLIGNTMEMYKHKNIVPMLYEMSQEKRENFKQLLDNKEQAIKIIGKISSDLEEREKRRKQLEMEEIARKEKEAADAAAAAAKKKDQIKKLKKNYAKNI